MIELNSIEEQELSKLAGFAVNPQAQRLGYSDKKQYKLERDLSLAVIKGKSDILWLADRYAKSYRDSNTPTVNQYRDYLVSLMLVEFVKDLQYYDNSNKLTIHTVRSWSEFGYKKLWPHVSDNNSVPSLYGWGPLGSLSFYTYYSPIKESYGEDSWDLQIIDCLRLMWLAVGERFDIEDSDTVPNERLHRVLERLGLTGDFVALIEELFSITFKETAIARRRRGEIYEDYGLIKQRLIFTEYPQDLYQDMLLLAPDKLKEDFTRFNNRVLSVAKPAGMRLILQGIVVESLLKSIRLLTDLADIWKNQPLVSYLRFNAYTEFGADDIRKQIAKNWIMLSDAKYLQRLFNEPPLPYKEDKNVYLWRATVPDLDTSLSAHYRLTSFL